MSEIGLDEWNAFHAGENPPRARPLPCVICNTPTSEERSAPGEFGMHEYEGRTCTMCLPCERDEREGTTGQ